MKSRFVQLPGPVGREFAAALGLDPNRVASIELRLAINEVATVRVAMYANAKDVENCIHTLRKYKIVPLDIAP